MNVSVRGLTPARVERPLTREDLARWLQGSDGAVVPVGGATRLSLGGPLDADLFTAVDLTGLDRVIDHAADDLTITVEPGVRLAALGQVLAGRGQWLPLDPPFPAEATVGGLVATAAWGPLRPFGDTPRRHLIGISVLDGNGVVHRAGGRVVKNVAGYDLMKLHTGALGTLGIIVEMSFRVHPLPETEALVLGRAGEPEPVARLARELNRSSLEPSTFLVYDSATAAELHGEARFASPLGVAIGFLGFAEDVAWCVRELETLARAAGVVIEHRVEGERATRLRERLSWTPRQNDVELRAAARPTETFGVLHDLADALESDVRGGGKAPLLFLAYPGLGIVRAIAGPESRITAASLRTARREIAARGGHVVIESCTDALARDVDVWGDAPASPVPAGLKNALDPGRRFNPGRFAGGL